MDSPTSDGGCLSAVLRDMSAANTGFIHRTNSAIPRRRRAFFIFIVTTNGHTTFNSANKNPSPGEPEERENDRCSAIALLRKGREKCAALAGGFPGQPKAGPVKGRELSISRHGILDRRQRRIER